MLMERTSESRSSFLDRPVFGSFKLTWWGVIYAALILFILLTRFWDLSSRAYCHDESIHAWESWKLATGQGYIHSPTYHGPFGYHLTAFMFTLFGNNDFTGRLAAVLAGIAITIMPLFLRKWLGDKGVLAATLLAAVSPVMMHRSRYFRHDQFNLIFNMIMFVAMLRYLDQRKTRDLYIVAAALSFGFTTKETTFITYFCFGVCLLGLFLWQWLVERRRAWLELPVFDLLIVVGTLILPLATPFPVALLGRNPIDYSSRGILFTGGVFLVMVAIGAAIGIWWNWRRWLVCAGLFYAIFIPLFTTMFTNPNGFATGMVGSLGYWLSQHDVKRGGQPWFYYLVLMPIYEFLPLILGLGGTAYYALRGNGDKRLQPEPQGAPRATTVPFVPFVIVWTWLAFAVYSWSGEKMPWLCTQLVVPLHLLAGWMLGKLLEGNWEEVHKRGGLWLLVTVPLLIYSVVALFTQGPSGGTTTEQLGRSMSWITTLVVVVILAAFSWNIVRQLQKRETLRMVVLGALVILLALTIRFAWMATYINADLANEFLVYAQGAPDTALVTRELEYMSRRLSGDLSMKVAYDDDSSWPFVWYLRNFTNAQFYGKKPGGPFDAEVVIVGPPNEAGIKPFLGNKYYRRQYRLVWWPNQDWYMNTSLQKIWRDLRDPIARRKAWDVLYNRKYDAQLTAWPFVHNFAMYIRRDVAQQLWDYGPEVMVSGGALPGDEYVEKWKQIAATTAWGMPGNQAGQMRSPKAIALDAQGNIYVADTFNHRVQVLDPNGRFLRQFGREGTLQGQFKEPWGIAVARNGDIYVADTWNHRIQVFDREGTFKRMWGTFGEAKVPTEQGTLLYGPRDLFIDEEGFLYVADTGNKRIIKYDLEGKMIAAVGGLGDGDGQMQEPVGIAVAADGSLYVADTWNRRIQVFDKNFNFLRKWPVIAWDSVSVVNKPYLALDQAENVYVTDPEGYRVIQFDKQGKVLAVWGQQGSDLSSMNLPTGIRVDKSGRIIVADSENHRLLVFAGK